MRSALNDLVAGHIPTQFAEPTPALPLVRAGKIRALGVSSTTRLAPVPDIPTLAEAGVPGFDFVSWQMIVAPAGTPKPIVDRLHRELKAIIALPEVQAGIRQDRPHRGRQPAAGGAAQVHARRDRAARQGGRGGGHRQVAMTGSRAVRGGHPHGIVEAFAMLVGAAVRCAARSPLALRARRTIRRRPCASSCRSPPAGSPTSWRARWRSRCRRRRDRTSWSRTGPAAPARSAARRRPDRRPTATRCFSAARA